jgi:hypothetical protein
MDGVVATPIAGIVPFLKLGRSEDVQCGTLMQQARQIIEQPSASQVALR